MATTSHGITSRTPHDGVTTITVDFPPVNALPVRGWFDLAAALQAAGSDEDTRVVVLRAEGRGFNAGVDIKEMQCADDHTALVGATHLSRLVPQQAMRAMHHTASTVDARKLLHYGTVHSVVPAAELDAAAPALADDIAAKDTRVIRRAKQAVNGIDPQDVHRSYRYEQGFTFELNLTCASDEARDEFVRHGGERHRDSH